MVIAGLVVRSRRSRGAPSAPIATPSRPALAARLAKTREALGGRLRSLFAGSMDQAFWEGLEEALIAADVGVKASTEIVGRVRESNPASTDEARQALRRELLHLLARDDRGLNLTGHPAVVIVVGVNGTGKTTSIAKLASQMKARGLEPLLGRRRHLPGGSRSATPNLGRAGGGRGRRRSGGSRPGLGGV